MSDVEFMKDRLNVWLKKAMSELENDGSLAPGLTAAVFGVG